MADTLFFMLLSTFALRRQDRKLRRGGGGAPEAGWNLAHHSEYRQNNYLPNADGSRAYHAPSCTCGLGFHAFKEERVFESIVTTVIYVVGGEPLGGVEKHVSAKVSSISCFNRGDLAVNTTAADRNLTARNYGVV